MTIERVATLSGADRADLIGFWMRAWRDVFPAIDFVTRGDWLAAYLDDLMRAGTLLLVTRAAAGGSPVAFLTLDPTTGTVDQIAVDPDHAGRGLARALIAEAKHLSPTGLALRVNKANARAFRLYGRAGFVVTGEAVSEGSGLPIWLMAWRGDNAAPP